MYAFGVRLRYANLSNIMLGISNSLFDHCNVTITLYMLIYWCDIVPLVPLFLVTIMSAIDCKQLEIDLKT